VLALFPLFGKNLSKEDKRIVEFLRERFGYKPKRMELFHRALTHKSIANQEDLLSNERLEFLGDAVLDTVIAEMLYNRFPDEDEGYLTKIKSKLVNRRTLGSIGREMNIGSVLHYNKSRSIRLETIEGNAFEAIIGAIYLDSSLATVQKSIQDHILIKYIDVNQVLEEEIDFKSRLYIWSQKNRLDIEFEVMAEENNGGAWEYKMRVLVNEVEYGMGIGTSKKRAEQAAAKETLMLLGEI
jgi:ribonuclease-3